MEMDFVLPKLIVSDVDGTLIDMHGNKCAGFDELVQLSRNFNLPLTLASGRCYENLVEFIVALGIDYPVLVRNGAGAVQAGQVLWTHQLETGPIREVVEYADALGMLVVIGDSLTEFGYRENAYARSFVERYQKKFPFHTLSDAEWDGLSIQKVLIVDPEVPGRINSVLDRLGSNISEVGYVCYDDRSVDIMPKACNKGNGLARLAQDYGIRLDEIMVIGDSFNDIEMVTMAGIGVAVANGVQELKDVADYVCTRKQAAGVVEAIEHFFLKKMDFGG